MVKKKCLWRAGRAGWARLTQLVSEYRQLLTELEFSWARVATTGATDGEVIDLLATSVDTQNRPLMDT